MSSLLNSLNEFGFVVKNNATIEEFESIAMSLGKEVLRTNVRVETKATAMVTSNEPIEWHQDSTEARWMAWFCFEPGEENANTEITLIDSIIESFSIEQRHALEKVFVADRLSDGREIMRPMYKDSSIYFCPWLVQKIESKEVYETLALFKNKVNNTKPIHSQSWKHGQILIIDNHRCLHRRPQLGRQSQRHLLRLWIKAREENEI